ncbi:MAG: hypothetical protein U0414_25670 [Polyangiaceae bacterium]
MRRRGALSLALLGALFALGCGARAAGTEAVEVDVDVSRADEAPDGSKAVRVVRMIRKEPLAELLREQVTAAAASGERILVMTNAQYCRACGRFLHALEDPRVRAALTGVVVVRVDVARYPGDIVPLGLDSYVMPGLFLLDEGGHARDGISGAEWTDDTAANIAPVIEAFVNERYRERKAPLPPRARHADER